jgi:pimeloyl-ACP methyl ester carboxylesterase
MGLQNRWDLWMSNDSTVAVISIRGTTGTAASWLANFYAAMVPAKGYLQLEKNYRFDYHLADDPKAAVHTGYLVSSGMLARDILPRLDSLTSHGIRNIIITGHSQGGGIAYLLTAYLYSLRNTGRIPGNTVIKTYCSAAPKPGNLYFAYAYEAMTASGWAYNVVNSSDWVPEMPVSVQTTGDYNDVNPFTHAVPTIKKQKFFTRILLMRAYRKLSNRPRKSLEDYQELLGDKLYIFISKSLPEFEKPEYFNSINYVRTGKTIVLLADEQYKIAFPDDDKQNFMHHYYP